MLNSFGHLGGIKIISSLLCVDHVQVKFPRTKKRRIQKKWRKNPKNYIDRPSKTGYMMGDTFVCHPAMCKEIERLLNADPARHRTDPISSWPLYR